MATGKKSFLIYCDLIHTLETLTDEEAGKLFKHVLRYVNDKNPSTPDRITQIAFEPIKQQLKRDLKDWENKSERNREIANAAWSKRKDANAYERKRTVTKNTDTDKDTVTDKVTDIDIRKEEFVKEVHSHPTYQPFFEQFINYWTEPNQKKTKMRFELEKTWHTMSRLATWKSRAKTNFKTETIEFAGRKELK